MSTIFAKQLGKLIKARLIALVKADLCFISALPAALSFLKPLSSLFAPFL
jgi:hypothetical protein